MNLGMTEILIILLIALLLFGPRKLPELGRSLGQSIREFQRGAKNIREEFEKSANVKDFQEIKEELSKPLEELSKPLEELKKPLEVKEESKL
jgi:sec-independent protein translocase protein TatA